MAVEKIDRTLKSIKCEGQRTVRKVRRGRTYAVLPEDVPASLVRSLSSNRSTSVSSTGMKILLRVWLDSAMSTSARLTERREASLGDRAEAGRVEMYRRKALDAGLD